MIAQLTFTFMQIVPKVAKILFLPTNKQYLFVGFFNIYFILLKSEVLNYIFLSCMKSTFL